MIVYGAIVVAIVTTLIFYLLKKSEYTWWEFFIPVGATTIAIILTKLIINAVPVQFTEYWGETITAVYEQEPYNYWHTQMCSRQVPCGTDSEGNTKYCTEYYDCSHQDDVGPDWICETDLEKKYNITEKQHDSIKVLFTTKRIISSTHNNYDPRDRAAWSKGTKFEGKVVGETSYVYATLWNKSDLTRKGYFTKHKYENRIKASDLSLFNISVVSEKQADSLELYKYPKVQEELYFPTILGKNILKDVQEKFKRLNAKYGPTNKLRLWILVFEDKPEIIATYQENYWVKGNKNELVVCIGKKGNEIQWAHSFSWALSDELTAETAQKVLDLYTYRDSVVASPVVLPVQKEVKKQISKATKIDTSKLPPALPLPANTLNVIKIKSLHPILNEQTWNDYYEYLNQNLSRFEKRSFEEFNYLKVEPGIGAIIAIYIIALGASIGLNYVVTNNEIKDDKNESYRI